MYVYVRMHVCVCVCACVCVCVCEILFRLSKINLFVPRHFKLWKRKLKFVLIGSYFQLHKRQLYKETFFINQALVEKKPSKKFHRERKNSSKKKAKNNETKICQETRKVCWRFTFLFVIHTDQPFHNFPSS